MQMGDDNPRIMFGVIITVYVDRQTTTVRSFRARPRNDGMWKRGIGRTKGYDRRANLLAYIRQLRSESQAGDSKHDGVECENVPDRPNAKEEIWAMGYERRGDTASLFQMKKREKQRAELTVQIFGKSLNMWSEGYHAAAYEVEETHEDNFKKQTVVRS
ncbi:hypothetical protein YC2023_017376 [Brassica napus]